MKIKCQKCKAEQDAHFTENAPEGTFRIESNFCPDCDGDFYEEEFFDKDGNQIMCCTQ